MAKFKHTTNPGIPQSETTNIHHHAPSYPILLIVGVGCLVLVGWLVQQWLISLLDMLHFSDPSATFALLVLSLVVGLPLLLLLNWLFRGWAETRHRHKLELEDKQIERLTIIHQMQNSVVADTRETSPKITRRNKLIVALVADGLQGRHNFSYRKAGRYTLEGEGDKELGKDSTVVEDALTWLRERGAIKSNKLTDRYTSIGQVQRELYAPPVVSSVQTTTTSS